MATALDWRTQDLVGIADSLNAGAISFPDLPNISFDGWFVDGLGFEPPAVSGPLTSVFGYLSLDQSNVTYSFLPGRNGSVDPLVILPAPMRNCMAQLDVFNSGALDMNIALRVMQTALVQLVTDLEINPQTWEGPSPADVQSGRFEGYSGASALFEYWL